MEPPQRTYLLSPTSFEKPVPLKGAAYLSLGQQKWTLLSVASYNIKPSLNIIHPSMSLRYFILKQILSAYTMRFKNSSPS